MKILIRVLIIWLSIAISQLASGFDRAAAGVALSLPELSWAIEVDAPDFVIEEKELNATGASSRLFASKKGQAYCCQYFWSLQR